MKRKMRKQVDGRLNMWDWDAEVGQRVIDLDGKVYDLVESTGWGKRMLGELTPRLAAVQRRGARAKEIDGVWYWMY